MAKKRVDFVISEKGAGKVAAGFKKVDNSVASAAKSAAMYAGAYIGVRGIISITKRAIEAFGIQEDAEKKLEVALGGVSKELLAQASALQQLTTSGDETIIGVQASIAAFTDNEQAIARATEATLDMAAATGMDLKAAGDLVAKSLGSSTNALSRYGVEVTGAVGSTERLDTLTGNIADKFAGQAAAAAETMAGQMQQASNAVGDAAESFGELLAPRVVEVAGLLKDGAEAVIEFIDSFSYRGDTLSKWSEDLEGLSEQMSRQVQTLIKMEKLYGRESWEAQQAQDALNKTRAEHAGVLQEIEAAERGARDSISATTEEVESLEDELIQLGEVAMTVYPMLSQPDTWEEIQSDLGTTIDMSNMLAQALGTAFDPDLGAGEGIKGFILQFLSLIEGAILATGALSSALTFAWVPGLGVGAAIAAIATLEAAKAGIGNVKFAATGADFVTDGPQLMMVGEAGREQVSVTPLEGPNLNGPQGGITIQVMGDFIGNQDFVEGTLIPAINLAQNQGRASIA